MIPRFKPYLGKEELVALFRGPPDAVTFFESEFAQTFDARYAVAFPYGRSALWAFFSAVGLENAEIIMPAYTCTVVAHAVVLSTNIPRFVDISLHDYNMDLDQVEVAINDRTRAVVATHLFGYPLDVDRLNRIVRAAEERFGHKIWIIQDCAHAFGTQWNGQLVCNEGDVALFGLNISKMITSVFGGMMTTNDRELYQKLRAFRATHFVEPPWTKHIRRFLYLLAVYPAFNEQLYGLVNWLQEATPLLNGLTKAYHLDEKVHLPPDYLERMLDVEARVGLAQLRKYPEIVRRRQENAQYYTKQLQDIADWEVPPLVDGATYSHYVIRVPDRASILKALQRKGIQLGQLIEYSVPHMTPYLRYTFGQDFPNSRRCSQHTINLPVYAHLQMHQRERIIESLIAAKAMVRNAARQPSPI